VLISTDEVSRLASPVNRYGYPPGEGHSSEEQRGPYHYVYATVTKVHFGENAQYYTVMRADTGTSQRADDEWMEPLKTARGEAAARRAASHFEDSHDNVENDSNHSHDALYILIVPFIWLWRCIYHNCVEKCLRFTRRQANLFLNGAPPYSCSSDFTMVNFFVLCNIWMVFMDQARLAFFPPSADFPLAIVDFFVWVVLVIELLCEVFVRPEGYQIMLFSEKAYAPSTAQFITRFHLFGEIIALLTFVTESVCLFSRSECSDRLSFSLFNALYMEVLGPTRLDAFFGRAFIALVRLRVFGLVRHWKNMWIHNTFITMTPTGLKAMVGKQNHTHVIEAEEKDMGLTNAANIGTALMVINSHRALIILWAIMGCLPLFTVINVNGNANLISVNMVNQLQAINQIVTEVGNPDGCDFLTTSIYAWATGIVAGNHANLDNNEYTPYVLYLWMEPRRCPFSLVNGNLTESDETATSVLCSLFESIDPDLLTEQEANIIKTVCTVWGNGEQNATSEELASKAGIRVGAIQDVYFSTLGNLTLEDGTVNETIYSVAAKFNQTTTVGTAAFASFLLQACLLICVLGGLTVLRRDAIVLVLGPLRRMLKIVARYAKNPLAHNTASHSNKGGNDSDEESDIARASSADQLGNFETTQLINAITKIADLLRKCWGVAGADIISTNLATQEGALTEVFNPTVPGKSVYALFGFAAINEFSHMIHNLGPDVMILINDVANVLHDEVFRWGYGDSGQCNKNLGGAFLMVFRIGLVKEVIKKLERATNVVFAGSTQKGGVRRRKESRVGSRNATFQDGRGSTASQSTTTIKAMSLNLQSLPGISTFTDRAVIGMLKCFACIYRDEKLLAWRDDFRLGAGVGAFSVNMFFGLDAGWAVEGAVGSGYKIDATYLSPHVNMASRMMSACKQYGVSILLSQAVQELMSSTARSKLRHLDTITVKGSSLKQRIYTYDARHKGVDFFLFSRSDEQADLDAEQYSPRLWEVDMDLRAMRQHVTEDFLVEFNKGRDYYLHGEWKKAIKHLERADEIMVENVMDLGYIEEELNELRNRIMDGEILAEEELRNETGDGPSRCLITFMKNAGSVAPKDWKGYRPLTSK
jgi:class 3 adenylate cyclase